MSFHLCHTILARGDCNTSMPNDTNLCQNSSKHRQQLFCLFLSAKELPHIMALLRSKIIHVPISAMRP